MHICIYIYIYTHISTLTLAFCTPGDPQGVLRLGSDSCRLQNLVITFTGDGDKSARRRGTGAARAKDKPWGNGGLWGNFKAMEIYSLIPNIYIYIFLVSTTKWNIYGNNQMEYLILWEYLWEFHLLVEYQWNINRYLWEYYGISMDYGGISRLWKIYSLIPNIYSLFPQINGISLGIINGISMEYGGIDIK